MFGDNEDFGVKSCWVRNLIEAPEKLETKLMEKGVPPMLTKEFCKFPKGQESLNADNLEIVWLEGDGAALLENGEILCVILDSADLQSVPAPIRKKIMSIKYEVITTDHVVDLL